eukprot:Hpha_TRINITY_DN3122_c0_g1::TRINITY_DN3122_c0_g1_i1::g.96685::m.96685
MAISSPRPRGPSVAWDGDANDVCNAVADAVEAFSEPGAVPGQSKQLLRVSEFVRLYRGRMQHHGLDGMHSQPASPGESSPHTHPPPSSRPRPQGRGSARTVAFPPRPPSARHGRQQKKAKAKHAPPPPEGHRRTPEDRLQGNLPQGSIARAAVKTAMAQELAQVFNRDLPSNLHVTGKAEELYEELMRTQKAKNDVESGISEEERLMAEAERLYAEEQGRIEELLFAAVNIQRQAQGPRDSSVGKRVSRLRDNHCNLMQRREAVRQKTAELERLREEHEMLSRQSRSAHVSLLEGKVKVFDTEVQTLRMEHAAAWEKRAGKDVVRLAGVKERLRRTVETNDSIRSAIKKAEEAIAKLEGPLAEQGMKLGRLQEEEREALAKQKQVREVLDRDFESTDVVHCLRSDISALQAEADRLGLEVEAKKREIDGALGLLDSDIGDAELRCERSSTKSTLKSAELKRLQDEQQRLKRNISDSGACHQKKLEEYKRWWNDTDDRLRRCRQPGEAQSLLKHVNDFVDPQLSQLERLGST